MTPPPLAKQGFNVRQKSHPPLGLTENCRFCSSVSLGGGGGKGEKGGRLLYFPKACLQNTPKHFVSSVCTKEKFDFFLFQPIPLDPAHLIQSLPQSLAVLVSATHDFHRSLPRAVSPVIVSACHVGVTLLVVRLVLSQTRHLALRMRIRVGRGAHQLAVRVARIRLERRGMNFKICCVFRCVHTERVPVQLVVGSKQEEISTEMEKERRRKTRERVRVCERV